MMLGIRLAVGAAHKDASASATPGPRSAGAASSGLSEERYMENWKTTIPTNTSKGKARAIQFKDYAPQVSCARHDPRACRSPPHSCLTTAPAPHHPQPPSASQNPRLHYLCATYLCASGISQSALSVWRV